MEVDMDNSKMTLKQKVDNHTGIFFIGTLIAGFVAGVTCYAQALDLLQYTIVTKEKKEDLEEAKKERDKLKDHVIELRIKLASLKQITQEEIMAPIMKLESHKRQAELNRKKAIEAQKKLQEKQESERFWTQVKCWGMAVVAIIVLIIIGAIASLLGLA